ncbi:MAG: TonB-dependent receptor [Robiginitomaculum sp.]
MFKTNTRLMGVSTIALVSVSLCAGLAHAQTNTNDIGLDNEKPVDEIVVTGISPLSATSDENLAGVSILTNEELSRRLSGSLGETLKFEPGISSTFFGPGASRPIIRGQGGVRVLLLDNGIGAIDASSASPDHAASVEPAMAGRIEVIRGAGLLRYGSSAAGGVINVIDGRIPDSVPSQQFEGAARFSVSSADNGYEGALGSDISLGALGQGNLVGHVEAAYRKTQDYNIPGFARSATLQANTGDGLERDVLENSATRGQSYAAGLSYIGARNFIGGAIKALDSRYGVPGGEGTQIILKQTRYDFNSKYNFMGNVFETLSIAGGGADYEHKEIEASGDTGTVFTNKGWEVRAELVEAQKGHWQAAYGAQYKSRKFAAIGEEAFVPPTTTKQFGLFTFHDFDFDGWHLEASGRYEHTGHENSVAGAKINYDGLSFSLGSDFHITDTLKLGGTVYRTERAPTSEEIFSNGPHLATNQFEIGKLDLGKEIATGAEVSLRYKNGGDHLTLNGFLTDYDDYVFERTTGAIMDGLSVSQFTPAQVRFKGFEIDVGKNIGSFAGLDWDVDGSIEYVSAHLDKSAPNALPRIPPLGFTFGLEANAKRWGARAELDHAAHKKDLAARETLTQQFTLLNAYIHYDLTDTLRLRASVLNITDQEARQHTSFLKDVVPLPGRNFKFSLEARF